MSGIETPQDMRPPPGFPRSHIPRASRLGLHPLMNSFPIPDYSPLNHGRRGGCALWHVGAPPSTAVHAGKHPPCRDHGRRAGSHPVRAVYNECQYEPGQSQPVLINLALVNGGLGAACLPSSQIHDRLFPSLSGGQPMFPYRDCQSSGTTCFTKHASRSSAATAPENASPANSTCISLVLVCNSIWLLFVADETIMPPAACQNGQATFCG